MNPGNHSYWRAKAGSPAANSQNPSFPDGKRQKEDPKGTAFLLAFPSRSMFNLEFQDAILGAVISG